MRFHEITQLLFESRLDYLINTYSTQVGVQLYKDTTFRTTNVKQRTYDELASLWIIDQSYDDPSNNGMYTYTQWMIVQYIKGNFVNEDSDDILDDLTYFHENKQWFTQKNINKYTVDELYNARKQVEAERALLARRQIKTQINRQAKKVLDTENVLVIWPQTKEAAEYYSSGTRWYNKNKSVNKFDHYNRLGSIYIVIDRNTNEKFQLHFATGKIENANDDGIDPEEFVRKYPQVFSYFEQEFRYSFPDGNFD